ncbi:hypothetical protein MATL_G00191190 [Megalops atlanticus]|uniref:Cyclic GMP-AMP synthase n=1 Tax=Megalops atlanticus TaxID=7932 RepID=A0A9D3PNC3_MEGAT|nr:hypothetical protein MATL_G00191190 [Megalops atlanticus]
MAGRVTPRSNRAKSPSQARPKSPTKARGGQNPSHGAVPKSQQVPNGRSSGSAKKEVDGQGSKKACSPPARRLRSCASPPRNPEGNTRGRHAKNARKNNKCYSPDGAESPVEKRTEKSPSKSDCVGAPVDKVLQSTLDNLKIKKIEQSNSASIINDVVRKIIKHMRQTDPFRDVEELRTGSYYENVKISEPDEFDVMLAVPVDRAEIQNFDEDGAFYTVALKRGACKNALHDFLQPDGTISADKMLTEFRRKVKQAVRSFSEVVVERKKKGCPAVTLQIKSDGLEIGLDVVLSLKVHTSWPQFTRDGFKIDAWLGTKVKREFKFLPFYLVPKYEGKGNEEREGICAKDAWRISFSHIEKGILKNHGQSKTCCESHGTQCCRKPCLKLLKHLLHLLKQKHPKELSKFCSYLAKTTLLHACSSRVRDSDWELARLSDCFQQLLEDFVGHLRSGELYNFFIPTQNLLGFNCDKKSRDFLAGRIEDEWNNGFPIFRDRSQFT